MRMIPSCHDCRHHLPGGYSGYCDKFKKPVTSAEIWARGVDIAPMGVPEARGVNGPCKKEAVGYEPWSAWESVWLLFRLIVPPLAFLLTAASMLWWY